MIGSINATTLEPIAAVTLGGATGYRSDGVYTISQLGLDGPIFASGFGPENGGTVTLGTKSVTGSDQASNYPIFAKFDLDLIPIP